MHAYQIAYSIASMTTSVGTTLLFLLAMAATISGLDEMEVLQMVQSQVIQTKNWAETSMSSKDLIKGHMVHGAAALRDCSKLYGESQFRLSQMLSNEITYTRNDARTWLSAIMVNHRTCMDELKEKEYYVGYDVGRNLTTLLGMAIALSRSKGKEKRSQPLEEGSEGGLLRSWDPTGSEADFTVVQDGSGRHRTMKEAVDALAAMGHNRPSRAVIYVKSGVYHEKVKISEAMNNVMLVGDGIDKTIVTGDRDAARSGSTLSSSTLDISGDGFWARDITFENTAGPHKHQAVALKVSSDKSVFYKCSFKGYQDTLYVHSNRQFYRQCQIYGTVDFIFGNAGAVFQDSDIFARKPMQGQFNSITAQGRDGADEPTGIVIHGSRVRPASDLSADLGSFKTYLGRPWKQHSRTVYMKTDLDGFIEPKGWMKWDGSFALSTLFYGEYMNTGSGASTENRVNWPGFHVLSEDEAGSFTVGRFMDGDSWISASGVPYLGGV